MRLICAVAVASVVVGALGWGSALRAQAPDAAKVDAGKKAYDAQKCATCHQIDGVGSAKTGSVLDGVGSRLSAADVKKGFTNTDIDALVAYLETLKK